MSFFTNFHSSIWALFALSVALFFVARIFFQKRGTFTRLLVSFSVGGLIGLFSFDLLPAFLQGMSSVQKTILLTSLPFFVFLHRRLHRHHSGHEHADAHHCQDSSWDPMFWGFLFLHSFLDGAVLRLTFRYSPYLAQLSMLALFLHKGSEVFFVSAFSKNSKHKKLALPLTVYLLSFPIGAYAVHALLASNALPWGNYAITQYLTLFMALSLSGLLVCLITDSLAPLFKRHRPSSKESWNLVSAFAGLMVMFYIHKFILLL